MPLIPDTGVPPAARPLLGGGFDVVLSANQTALVRLVRQLAPPEVLLPQVQTFLALMVEGTDHEGAVAYGVSELDLILPIGQTAVELSTTLRATVPPLTEPHHLVVRARLVPRLTCPWPGRLELYARPAIDAEGHVVASVTVEEITPNPADTETMRQKVGENLGGRLGIGLLKELVLPGPSLPPSAGPAPLYAHVGALMGQLVEAAHLETHHPQGQEPQLDLGVMASWTREIAADALDDLLNRRLRAGETIFPGAGTRKPWTPPRQKEPHELELSVEPTAPPTLSVSKRRGGVELVCPMRAIARLYGPNATTQLAEVRVEGVKARRALMGLGSQGVGLPVGGTPGLDQADLQDSDSLVPTEGIRGAMAEALQAALPGWLNTFGWVLTTEPTGRGMVVASPVKGAGGPGYRISRDVDPPVPSFSHHRGVDPGANLIARLDRVFVEALAAELGQDLARAQASGGGAPPRVCVNLREEELDILLHADADQDPEFTLTLRPELLRDELKVDARFSSPWRWYHLLGGPPAWALKAILEAIGGAVVEGKVAEALAGPLSKGVLHTFPAGSGARGLIRLSGVRVFSSGVLVTAKMLHEALVTRASALVAAPQRGLVGRVPGPKGTVQGWMLSGGLYMEHDALLGWLSRGGRLRGVHVVRQKSGRSYLRGNPDGRGQNNLSALPVVELAR